MNARDAVFDLFDRVEDRGRRLHGRCDRGGALGSAASREPPLITFVHQRTQITLRDAVWVPCEKISSHIRNDVMTTRRPPQCANAGQIGRSPADPISGLGLSRWKQLDELLVRELLPSRSLVAQLSEATYFTIRHHLKKGDHELVPGGHRHQSSPRNARDCREAKSSSSAASARCCADRCCSTDAIRAANARC